MPPRRIVKPGTTGDAWTDAAIRRRQARNEDTQIVVPPSAIPAPPSTPGVPPGGAPPVTAATDPFKTVATSMLRYLSNEDAAALAAYYGLPMGEDERRPMWAPPPYGQTERGTVSGTARRNFFLSQGRAQNAMKAITNAMTAANISGGGGPGVAFLQNIIGLLDKFGATGGQGMSRSSYNEFSTAVDELFKQAEQNNDVSQQFRSLASMFARPTFSSGDLMEQVNIGGRKFFGSSNKKLYG